MNTAFFKNVEKPMVFTVKMSLDILLLGASWEHLGGILGAFGGLCWPMLAYGGLCWGIFPLWAASWSEVGRQVGPKLGQVGSKLGQVGAKMRHVGAKLAQVGAKVAQVGAKMEPTWASRGVLKGC